MKLNVLERVNILNVLPKESNIGDLRIIKDLRTNLSLTEKENKEFDFKVVPAGENRVSFTWNNKGNNEVDIEIGEKATDIITKALKELNKDNKLSEDYLTVADKFKIK